MSSSEEDVSMLREAVDPQFAGRFGEKEVQVASRGQKCKGQKNDGDSLCLPKSSRPNGINECDYHELGTTPEFRNHVAKKLSEILDSQIKICNGHVSDRPAELPPEENYGIRLFASSKHIMTRLQNDEENPCQLRRKPDLCKNRKRPTENSSSSSSDETEQLASVAVSSEWVMSRKGVYDCIKPPDQDVGKAEKSENGKRSGGHHRNVCRKKKHKDTKEKERRNKRPIDEDDAVERETKIDEFKMKHSKNKKKDS